MTDLDMQKAEETAYRESFSDGLIDLFAGLALIWIGACWLWLEPLAPFAPIVPAGLAPTLLPVRRRLVETSAGYVRWTAPRRAKERRQLTGLAALGVGALAIVAGGAAYLVVRGGSDGVGTLVAGLPALLVVIPIVVLAAVSGLRRLWGYALVLLAAAAVTVVIDAGPGWPLLAGGIVMSLSGVAMYARFTTAQTGEDEA